MGLSSSDVRPSPVRPAVGPARIALIYAAVAGTWILASDSVIAFIFDNPKQIAFIGMYKGLAFVLVTMMILYHLMRRMVRDLSAMQSQIISEQAAKLQALKLLEIIAEQSTDAIYVKDVAGRYMLFNRQAGHFVGRKSSDVVGLDDRALFPPEDAEGIMATDRQLMAEGAVRTFEEAVTTADGPRTFLTTKGPIYAEGDQLVGVFGITRDISERVAAQKALMEKADRLTQSNADLEQFANVASHDLQTPLRNVVSYAQMLDRRYRGQLDAEADDFIGFIVNNAKQITNLINDLLRYSVTGAKPRAAGARDSHLVESPTSP
jgi:PAS domain S-box-containing protein